MSREHLRSVLSAAQGEAVSTFLTLLDDPTADIHHASERHTNTAANLLTIYRRRADHLRRIGLPTLGFDETVERLETTSHERLALALGTGQGGHPSCVAFLAEDLSEVVAALAVLGPPPQG